MTRLATLSALAIACAPLSLAAQDHAGHGGHAQHGDHAGHHSAPEEPDAKPEMDHCAMGHLPPEQCPPKADKSAQEADHSAMDHSKMDHSQHTAPDHSAMDHSQHGGKDHSGHAGHTMGPDKSAPGAAPENAVPARAFDGPRHAADAIWGEAAMAPSRKQLAKENGAMQVGMVLIERLETRFVNGEEVYLWDGEAWYGSDTNKLWFKSEGEGEFGHGLEEAEVQALWSHAIGPFFDLQAGARYDIEPRGTAYATVGVLGLAPYMFHVDAALFLSERGDLTARVEAEYDQKITQALILQPRIEIEAAAQGVPELELGAGLNKVEAGLRLRYEITREFAPYVGVEYEAKLGRTADIARAQGDDPDGLVILAGIRAWF